MPYHPDIRAHATHDLELVAAYAAGDATGPDLETATALVAGCADCSALHHDLRLIAAALPALPAARRTRDFRLTPEQAASLRPAGWRRLLGAFAGPRFSVAAPLGTGLATLGLAGLLLGTLAGSPLGAGSGNTTGASPDRAFSGAAPELVSAAASMKDQVTTLGEVSPAPASNGGPGAVLQPRSAALPAVEPSPRDAAGGGPGLPLVGLASAAAVLIGVALVALRLIGRRLAPAS
jgi:hypothetical protein